MGIAENHREDDQFAGLIRSGSVDEFASFVNRHRKQVIRICRGYVGSAEDAEDIAQDVFIEFYNSLNRFRGESRLSTWLFRIAINKSLNHIRDNRRKFRVYRSADASGEEVLNVSRIDGVTDSDVINQDHSRALHSAIDALPDNQKTAFILNKYEDLSYREIAEVMETSHSSVESLIFRAKQNLQKSLADYFEKNLK
ncbi:MAG: RNA polymerase sigma factor [Bacteroidales bacterium]